MDRVRGGRQKYRRNPTPNAYETMQYLFQSNINSLSDIKILKVLIECEPNIINANFSRQNYLKEQQHTQYEEQTFPTNNNNNNNCNYLTLAVNDADSELDDTLSNTDTTNVKNIVGQYHSIMGRAQTPTGSNSSDNVRDIAMDSTPPSTPTTTFNNWNSRSKCREMPYQMNNNNNNDGNNHQKCDDILNALSNIYDEELVNIIGWAKQIPGFIDLALNDQMKLLQVSWAEILTLQLVFRSLPFKGKLCFASNIWMDELLAKECGYTEFYYHSVQLAKRLELLSPRREEYYMLKALVLANCDTILEEQSSLQTFRSTILNALNDVVFILRQNLAVSHQQQLLLLLPSLRQANEIIKRFWRKIHCNGELSLKKLFAEMLEPVPLR